MATEFDEFFSVPGESQLPPDILGELQSTARMHDLTPQELFFKWEGYSIKMGSDETKLDSDTVRAFKKDILETLERENRGKANLRGSEKKTVHATPRAPATSDDLFGLLDGVSPGTPQTVSKSSTKRKAPYETPAPSKIGRSARKSSPTEGRTPSTQINGVAVVPFVERQNAGQIIETLNDGLSQHQAPIAPHAEARIKLTSKTDLKKFYYKPMAMHLSEASEILDDRIDEFTALIQQHYNFEDGAFGNAASKSTNEIVAVGRIASDSAEGKLNAASMVLEMSRRAGAGLRIPVKFTSTISHQFFPGQIVAVRGINASGEYFSVTEILEVPLLPPPVSQPSALESIMEQMGIDDPEETNPTQALNIMTSAGPYTTDDNLDFEPLHALCDKATETCADVLILIGPLLDVEHPMVAMGDFELPEEFDVEPDKATLSDVFKAYISPPIRRLAQAIPNITIIIIPSARDAVNKHVSWPQEPMPKKELGLPKQVKMVSNPVTISINEIIIGISAQDILNDLRREEVAIGVPKEPNLLSRLPRHIIQQRHFFPIYPPVNRSLLPKAGTEEGIATGTPLDTSYLKLGEWLNVQPDMLILPSALTPFAKVVESVVVVNPGTLSKRRGAGSYAQMSIHPRRLTDAERSGSEGVLAHNVFERARVDIVRI